MGTGLAQQDIGLLIAALGVLLFSDILRYKNISAQEIIAKQDWLCQIVIIVFSFLFIMLFGVWGSDYDAANFIYFQF